MGEPECVHATPAHPRSPPGKCWRGSLPQMGRTARLFSPSCPPRARPGESKGSHKIMRWAFWGAGRRCWLTPGGYEFWRERTGRRQCSARRKQRLQRPGGEKAGLFKELELFMQRVLALQETHWGGLIHSPVPFTMCLLPSTLPAPTLKVCV